MHLYEKENAPYYEAIPNETTSVVKNSLLLCFSHETSPWINDLIGGNIQFHDM